MPIYACHVYTMYYSTQTCMFVDAGVLSSVSSISRVPDTSNIMLTWKPPYSLNLTGVEPDVAYCIDIYNVTDGAYDHLISTCDVTTTWYTFSVSHPDPRDLFQFTVTPRSNIAGAKNGTPSEPMEAYFYGNHISYYCYVLKIFMRSACFS